MTRLITCPDCAAKAAFNQALLKANKTNNHFHQAYCNRCRGSGKIRDDRDKNRRFEKRRKDMSGEEWTEADAYWDRERERMEREE